MTPPKNPYVEAPVLIHELEGWFSQLKRNVAGFSALHGSLMSATGQMPPGERQRGLPLFEFPAPVIGNEIRESVKCVVDLKKVDPNYISHVLVPIINAQAVELMESLEEIDERIKMLRPLLQQMLTPNTPGAATPPQ